MKNIQEIIKSEKHYVYILLDINVPFYIGKGFKDRIYHHEIFARTHDENDKKDYNTFKTHKIRKIIREGREIKYKIVFLTIDEAEAYKEETHLIKKYGRRGIDPDGILTNRLLGGKMPPSRKGRKRSQETVERIRQGAMPAIRERLIEYVIINAEKIYIALSGMKQKEHRGRTLEKANMTIDLYQKIRTKKELYIEILNSYTEYNIESFELEKINGMRIVLFNEKREILNQYYFLLDRGYKRRTIAKILNVTPDQLSRWRNLREEFEKFINFDNPFHNYKK